MDIGKDRIDRVPLVRGPNDSDLGLNLCKGRGGAEKEKRDQNGDKGEIRAGSFQDLDEPSVSGRSRSQMTVFPFSNS